ncbi:VanZ family protein [Bosea thiooxidans]
MNPTLEKIRRAAIPVAWGALLAIMAATLLPIDVRPHVPGLGPNTERFLAYFTTGALLSLAYPRQRWLLLAGIVAFAIGLEWLQTLEATRHGAAHDALVKCAGAVIGAALPGAFEQMSRRPRQPA